MNKIRLKGLNVAYPWW